MKKKRTKLQETIINIAELIFVAGMTFLVFTYIVNPVKIEGSSMAPTVHDKDLALVNVLGVKQEGVDRFDVVIVSSDRVSEKLIKRVIGLPGETIEYKNDKLYVDGKYVEETFLDASFMESSRQEMRTSLFTDDFRVVLRQNEYFVLGDNRLHSADSRVYGPFKLEEFSGKNGTVIFPFDAFGWINKS